MLASQPGRPVLEYSGVLRCRSILYCVLFLLLAFLHDPVISEEAQCTKSTLRDHLRKSFKVFKLGRTRNIKSCINLCCSRRNCDLALLRRTRCYGISCSHHDLCRGIMNGLREKRHEISKRSIEDTEDIPSDFSHHPRNHGFCRHRRVVPHHIFLEGGRGVSIFHKLATDVSSSRECNQYCCQRADCSLAFIMRDKCYGVICPDDGDCESGEETRVPVHLEIALLERRGSFGEASRVVDSDMGKKPSLSERRHHHHHHHHDGPAEDDTSYNQEHETQLPKKHHLQDSSTIPLHHHHDHHHHHHHHVHKSTYNPGVRESDTQSSSQESDQKRRYVKNHRHHNSEEREDSNQDNENDNSYSQRESGHHIHHHRMHHHRNVEHDTSHDSNERDDDIEEQNNSHRHRGHHKHVKMNSDMKQDNEDKDNDISIGHSMRKRKHHRHDKIDYFESPEDDRDRDAALKKHRKHEQHKTGGNSEGNDDEDEQSGTLRRKKGRPPEHHRHHQDEDNYNHEEKSMNGEDIMEFGDKDNDDEKVNGENFSGKHDKVDHENESSENEDFEHEQRKEDDDNQDKDMNRDQDNESEGTFTKNKHRHEDSHETSQETTDYKKHHQTESERLSSESKMRNNEMQDESEGDDEERPKEQRHKNKDRGKDKEDHYDQEMNNEDGQFGSGENEEERSKIKHEKDSNERRDEKMNDDEMENGKHINHQKKDENEMVDFNHNHDHHHRHDEDDVQAQNNEYHHHHHNDNIQDQNDDNTKQYKEEEKEQHHHRHHPIHHQHHHHHHHYHKNNAQEHNEEHTKQYKKEKQAMNSDPDLNEMENTDNEMSGNKMNEHHHHDHHHHHQKKTKKDHQERMTIENQHEDNHRKYENEYQEYSGSGDDSDNENIMSQNDAHKVYEQNHLDKSHQHNHNHGYTVKNHHYSSNEDRSDVKDNDEDRNFKSSKKKAKDYDSSKGENYGSSKKQKKTEDVFKNKRPNSREKEKMHKIEDNDKSEDKEDERNTIHNEEADRSEPKSKIHVHHKPDKDDDEDDSNENIVSDEENKIEKNKVKESISKKGKGKTSKNELDNDEINDSDSREDSKKNRNFKNKDDESDSITDENQPFKEHEDHNKAGKKGRHYKKEREDHLHKENSKKLDNSERKNTEHIQGERKYNEHHVEKETKYNSDAKDNQHKESKERKGKQEFVNKDSENTEHRNQKQERPLEVNHDHNNAKHHREKMKSSDGKIEDIKSNMDNQMEHESNNNQRSKVDNNDSNKHTDDRGSDSDDSEDSNDDAKQNHEYNSKVSTHDEHIHSKQGKHHTEKSHGYFESGNENDDNDQKNRESETDDGVREEAGPKNKNNNYKKREREDNGNERGDLSKDSSESKSDEMKNKNSHATISDHVDHKESEDNDQEKDNLSKNEDHKESKSNENNRKDGDEISSDHVDHKESYGDHKSKNTGRDKGNSEDDQGKDESTNENRKESESSKTKNTEDTDGIRRDHVDHGTSSSVEKKYAGNKHHTKANKDENSSSETTEENGMEHSGKKNDYKNRENIEEKQHEISSNKIGNTKDNRTSHSKENTIIPFKNEEITEHLNKNMANKGTNSDIQKNGTAGNKHENFMNNKLDNKFENTHEQNQVENGMKGFNKEETGSRKKLTKQEEHKIRNNSYDNKEKSGPLESEERRITGKHKERKEQVAIQKVTTQNGSSKTNVNEHSNMNQDQNNNPPRTDDNANTKNTQSVIEKQNDKHHHKNTGKSFPGEIKDIMDNNDKDKSKTGNPQHKPTLYHSLNALKEIKNNNGQKDKTGQGILPKVNQEHDIMKSNQNYTESENPKKEGNEEDKTKFFNQETNEWKESFKGDQVDESGKYFNQRTRGWSVNQPKTNTEYFHNLTSQWNLENKTKPSDFGKYFNQRTKTWLGNKVGNTYKKHLNDTIGSAMEKNSNTLNINGSMKGNKLQDSRKKILSSTNDNQKKHIQNITVYKPVQKHKLQSTIPKHEEGKSSPSQVIHNNTKVRQQFNHLKTSGTVIPTKVKQKVTKVKSAPHKVEDSETAEEKVKNEILKLIGEAPAKTTSSDKKTKNIGHRLINKHLEPSVNVSSHIDDILPKKPENIPQPKTILRNPKNITNALPKHQTKPYKSHTVGHNKILVGKFPHAPRKQKVLKTSGFNTKVKSKEAFDAKRPHGTKINSLPPKSKEKYRINSIRKQKFGPLLKQPQTKPIRPTQPLAIPIKQHFKFPKIRKKPVNSKNRVRPTLPSVNTWKGTLQKPSYTPTVSSIRKYDYQNWNKQNIFDNEWNNAKWNSYYNTYGSNSILQAPTVKPTLSWDSMAWNSNSNQQGNIINGYQNGGIEGRGQGMTPTIAPINRSGNANRNSQINRVKNYPNGGIEGKFQGIRPTLAPVNRNRQFPFTIDGSMSKSGKGQIGGMGNTPRVLEPTLAPPYRQGESPLNRNGGLNHGGKYQSGGHGVPVLRPTLAPPYRLGEFPLTKNGDRTNRIDYWNQNVKNPFGRQGPPVGSHPSRTKTKNDDMTNKRKDFWNQNVKTPYEGPEVGRNTLNKPTPRRNHVYYSENKQRVSNLTQNHVMKQPRKPASSQLTGPHTFVQPLGNVTSLIPPKKVPDQPVSIRNNYLKQNKVLSSGKMNSSQVQQTSKTIPTQVNILRRPTVPPQITRKPNQWNKTWTTTGIHHPFKVNKIEPLHGKTTTKDRPHPKVPKGCYPGEIMSEMTLENGLDAGNYTNLGRTELMDSCISKCCDIKSCEVAVQMDNVCFALKCHSKESCKIKTTLGKSSHHKLCFLSRKKKERQNIFDFDNDILGEQDVCHEEQAVGLSWKTTNAGSFDEIPCPKKAKGLARRKCSIESNWLLPDFSSCVTNEYEDLYQRAKRLVYGEDSSSLLQSLAVVTTRTIDNSLIFGGDLKKTTEIMTAIVQEQGARQDGGISQKDVKNYLITCSNLLDDSNKQEWRNIQNDARGSADILRDSQTYALIASSKLPETRTNITYVTNNIVVQMSYQEKGSKDKTFPDYTNTDVALWDGEKDNIRLPESVFSIGNIKTVTFSYKTLPALLPMDSNEHFRHSEPNSKILATIVEPRIQDKITPAVTITLHHLKQNRLNPRCVFWDFNLNPAHGGAWSTEGCWLESSTNEHTVCRCDHLANFAVLMDVADSGSMQASATDERYSKEMAAMWICIPVLVVLTIAALYIASTWSRVPRRRTLSEKSSLLRSSVTTDEMRYDYSSSPSHNLKGATPPKLKEPEWQNEFNKDVERMKDIGLEFDSSHQRMSNGQEMEHDSGIESNDHDDSHCDLSLSQENLEIREEQFQDYLEDIHSPQSNTLHYTESIRDSGNTSPVHSDTNFIQEKQTIHLDVERRIFSTNLRRCCGQEDLSSPK